MKSSALALEYLGIPVSLTFLFRLGSHNLGPAGYSNQERATSVLNLPDLLFPFKNHLMFIFEDAEVNGGSTTKP